jgi:glycine/D-amino acid oxidase-like deaminating enzyme
LVIGQGLVGTWLAYFLQERNLSYVIVNDSKQASASSVASGVINPVTGRRMVQTWMIEDVMPFAVASYEAFQQKTNSKIVSNTPVVLIHPSPQMKDSFDYRLAHDNVYLKTNNTLDWQSFFNTPFGTGEIDNCYWIDLIPFLEAGKKHMADHFIESTFAFTEFKIVDEGVQWKDILAEKIIFCDGVNSMQNPYFKALPFAPNKGEALIVAIDGLPAKHIYKNNIAIVPWKENLFWVGSSFEWQYENQDPTKAFKQKMMTALDSILKLPYQVVDHLVGIRPANTERRPFVGLHPSYPQLGICNGMGTKGCSLAPYFASELINHIELGEEINKEADIARFGPLLV